MAEIGYGVAVKVLELLGSVAFQEISSARGVKSDLTKLKGTVEAIKAVLLDAEKKQASDHRLSDWLGKLKDVLKDAENVVDEFQYIVLQKEVMERNGSTSKKVSNFFSSSNPLAVRLEMADKIKNIRKRVDEIAAEKDKFNLAYRLVDRKLNMQGRREMAQYVAHPRNVIGRDDDREKIIDLLMEQDAGRNVSVIPIVGIGGLGKTTLAKLVYNDERVARHFQLRKWVCVSEDFDVRSLIIEILKSPDGSINENLSIEQLQILLRELLKDNKFLLVLDDVWNEDRNKWMELQDLLLGGYNGSKIIVTTRNNSVATIMGTVPTYHLDGLSHEDCMSLFVKLAFKEGQENLYPNLLNIGREIVKKCKGVPLAVSTLAGLLYSKFDEHEWKSIRDHEIWNLKQNKGDFLTALKISYNQLPFHLKQCFAYCSIFPKDYNFNNVQLIQFWLAHGILQFPANESQELEDVGDLYIKELLSRTFFQDVDQDEFLPFYSFKMHDLVHDLALSIAKSECSMVTKKSILSTGVCHLSILENGQEVTTQLENLSKVRTIIFQTDPPMSLLETCISRFKYLRVLDLDNSSFEVLPNSVGSLIHLRSLDLTENRRIKQLPDSICKLHSLQTLLLAGCSNLERLPKDIRDIISLRFLTVTAKHTCLSEKAVGCLDSLRFLVINNCENLKCLFEGMEGRLTYLRTLIVSECPSLTSLSLSIKHLTTLENLIIGNCEELCLTNKEENQDLKLSLRLLMIRNLPKLEVLPQWLQASANTLQHLEIEDCCNFITLPEWLPHLKSLQTLKIIDCPVFSSLPKGMQDLTALTEIQIRNCEELSLTDKEENQDIKSSLRLVIIENLPKLEVLPHSLQTLLLAGCSNLEQLPKGIRDIISLRFLFVTTKHTCLLEKTIGCLDSLQSLFIVECENLTCLFEGMEEGRLTNLRTLWVANCPNLTTLSLSIKPLTALENLIIVDCEKLSLTDKEENQDLKLSLRLLMIENLPKLEVLPQWLQASANTLQHLEIEDCCNFTALPEWLPRLKSLQTLRIRNCPEFSSLP